MAAVFAGWPSGTTGSRCRQRSASASPSHAAAATASTAGSPPFENQWIGQIPACTALAMESPLNPIHHSIVIPRRKSITPDALAMSSRSEIADSTSSVIPAPVPYTPPPYCSTRVSALSRSRARREPPRIQLHPTRAMATAAAAISTTGTSAERCRSSPIAPPITDAAAAIPPTAIHARRSTYASPPHGERGSIHAAFAGAGGEGEDVSDIVCSGVVRE